MNYLQVTHSFSLWIRNRFQWNFIWNSLVFFHERWFQNVICKMAAILSRPESVNKCASKSWHRIMLFLRNLFLTTYKFMNKGHNDFRTLYFADEVNALLKYFFAGRGCTCQWTFQYSANSWRNRIVISFTISIMEIHYKTKRISKQWYMQICIWPKW